MNLKKCCICEEEFPSTLEFFHKRSNSNDGLRCDCKICRKQKKIKDYNKPTKKCSNCNIEKPNTNEYFYIRNGGKLARTRSLCRICHKLYFKYHHLQKTYRLTFKDYNNMYNSQNKQCLICKNEFLELVVDHCHRTGKVRGLLCDNCNSGIGMLKENIEYLQNAIGYINHHNSKTN